MKKLHESRKHFLVRRQRKLFETYKFSKMRPHIDSNFESNWVSIKMPYRLSLFNNRYRSELTNALVSIRNLVQMNQNNIRLDFSSTRYISAEAMLLLYSEIDRIENSGIFTGKVKCRLPRPNDHNLKSENYVNCNKVKQVLKHVGFLELCRQSLTIRTNRDDVIDWKVAKGKKSEGEKAEDILDTVENILGKRVAKKFYTGITEAMTNCHHHAYLESRNDGLEISDSGWWMFLETKEESLTIIICDLGIGIPRSLPKTHRNMLIDMLKDILGAGDSACIDFAAQTGSTSTDLVNRGKGLRKMVNIVREIENSSLHILSNKGSFQVKNQYEIMRKDFDDSIFGTLISWHVELAKSEVV